MPAASVEGWDDLGGDDAAESEPGAGEVVDQQDEGDEVDRVAPWETVWAAHNRRKPGRAKSWAGPGRVACSLLLIR